MPYFKITLFNEDSNKFEDSYLPGKFEVCPSCHGGGSQDVWDGGMTAEEFYEQGPDFAEDYAAGVYSKPCEECKGQRVVAAPDRSQLSPKQAKQLARYEAEQEAYYKELAAESKHAGYF
jgi:DnaJ-class molecular chaperone